jgi:hypothetical protein
MRTSHFAAGLALALAACTTGFADSSARLHRGIYVQSFEVSSFTPCGSSERWWLTFGSRGASREFDERVGGGDKGSTWGMRTYVEWEGTPGEPGRFGHLGAYPREFVVARVVQARPATDADCR